MKNYTIATLEALKFHSITAADFGDIAHFMHLSDSRTCDYTLGGIVLWADHFNYRIAISDNTLFVSGGREDNLAINAYAMPVGDSDFDESMRLLQDIEEPRPVWLSAVPEDRLHLFAALPNATVSELGSEWSDYLYDIHSLATLSGGAMKKKRNHVNRFLSDNPDARLVDFTPAIAAECRGLLQAVGHDDTSTGISEFAAVDRMLANWNDYAPYLIGMALVIGNRVVGFTVGEAKDDTLHCHVEKCDHTIAGANEALTSMFAAEMSRRNPRLLYVNRQDDAGDPGLRASKESWHPLRLLPKYNVKLS